jgi:hypothetical protein
MIDSRRRTLGRSVRTLGLMAGLTTLHQADPRFRSGLTATVVAAPPMAGHACVHVTLRWPQRDGAKAYQARVAPTRDGAWTALPSTSACGTSRSLAPTVALDPQPQSSSPTVRRLFYRIVALGSSGPIDSTDVVPVDIAPAPSGARQP